MLTLDWTLVTGSEIAYRAKGGAFSEWCPDVGQYNGLSTNGVSDHQSVDMWNHVEFVWG